MGLVGEEAGEKGTRSEGGDKGEAKVRRQMLAGEGQEGEKGLDREEEIGCGGGEAGVNRGGLGRRSRRQGQRRRWRFMPGRGRARLGGCWIGRGDGGGRGEETEAGCGSVLDQTRPHREASVAVQGDLERQRQWGEVSLEWVVVESQLADDGRVAEMIRGYQGWGRGSGKETERIRVMTDRGRIIAGCQWGCDGEHRGMTVGWRRASEDGRLGGGPLLGSTSSSSSYLLRATPSAHRLPLLLVPPPLPSPPPRALITLPLLAVSPSSSSLLLCRLLLCGH